MSKQGWRNEPQAHSLAARGIKVRPKSLKLKSNAPIDQPISKLDPIIDRHKEMQDWIASIPNVKFAFHPNEESDGVSREEMWKKVHDYFKFLISQGEIGIIFAAYVHHNSEGFLHEKFRDYISESVHPLDPKYDSAYKKVFGSDPPEMTEEDYMDPEFDYTHSVDVPHYDRLPGYEKFNDWNKFSGLDKILDTSKDENNYDELGTFHGLSDKQKDFVKFLKKNVNPRLNAKVER